MLDEPKITSSRALAIKLIWTYSHTIAWRRNVKTILDAVELFENNWKSRGNDEDEEKLVAIIPILNSTYQ